MSAIFQSHHARIGHCPGDVLGSSHWDEIVIAIKNEGWDTQRPEHGEQVDPSEDQLSFISRSSIALALRIFSLVKLARSLAITVCRCSGLLSPCLKRRR